MRKIALEHQGLVADIQIYLPSLELAIDSTKMLLITTAKLPT
ncbi:hypothetical protein [Trichodesmium erythraeum]|nr:hypothetical protein [Trichodesmium sp. St11_bin5]MDT9338063.1 hypothetical protein [Trichodesmium erythraeum 21-75]